MLFPLWSLLWTHQAKGIDFSLYVQDVWHTSLSALIPWNHWDINFFLHSHLRELCLLIFVTCIVKCLVYINMCSIKCLFNEWTRRKEWTNFVSIPLCCYSPFLFLCWHQQLWTLTFLSHFQTSWIPQRGSGHLRHCNNWSWKKKTEYC